MADYPNLLLKIVGLSEENGKPVEIRKNLCEEYSKLDVI